MDLIKNYGFITIMFLRHILSIALECEISWTYGEIFIFVGVILGYLLTQICILICIPGLESRKFKLNGISSF
jgi:hypothetical protein